MASQTYFTKSIKKWRQTKGNNTSLLTLLFFFLISFYSALSRFFPLIFLLYLTLCCRKSKFLNDPVTITDRSPLTSQDSPTSLRTSNDSIPILNFTTPNLDDLSSSGNLPNPNEGNVSLNTSATNVSMNTSATNINTSSTGDVEMTNADGGRKRGRKAADGYATRRKKVEEYERN